MASKQVLQEKTLQQLSKDYQFNMKEIEIIKRKFEKYSLQGIMNKNSFRDSMGILGLPNVSFISDRIFCLLDTDADGRVNFEEFLYYLNVVINANDKEKAQLSFQFLDLEQQDQLEKSDIEKMMTQVSLLWNTLTDSQGRLKAKSFFNLIKILLISLNLKIQQMTFQSLTSVIPQKQFIQQMFNTLNYKKTEFITFQQYQQIYRSQTNIIDWFQFFNQGKESIITKNSIKATRIIFINLIDEVIQPIIDTQDQKEKEIKEQKMKVIQTKFFLNQIEDDIYNLILDLKQQQKQDAVYFPQPLGSDQPQNIMLSPQDSPAQTRLVSMSSQVPFFKSDKFIQENHRVVDAQSFNQIISNSNRSIIFNPQNSTRPSSMFNFYDIKDSETSRARQNPIHIGMQLDMPGGDVDPDEEYDIPMVQRQFQLNSQRNQTLSGIQNISDLSMSIYSPKKPRAIQMDGSSSSPEDVMDEMINRKRNLLRAMRKKMQNMIQIARDLESKVDQKSIKPEGQLEEKKFDDQKKLFLKSMDFHRSQDNLEIPLFQVINDMNGDNNGISEIEDSCNDLQRRRATINNLPQKKEKIRRNLSIYIGHENWNLVLNIMIGIRTAVKQLFQTDNLVDQDYQMKEVHPLVQKRGSNFDFQKVYEFVDFAPRVFGKIREVCGVSRKQYLQSMGPQNLLGNLIMGRMSSLTQLVCGSESFEHFQYYTQDSLFLAKTISKEKSKFVRKLLKNYHHYIEGNHDTLLPRIYGLHQLKVFQSKTQVDKIYIMVMHNFFNSPLEIDARYQIKGATYGRMARQQNSLPPDKNTPLKDLDLLGDQRKLTLFPNMQQKLQNQIEKDTLFLQENKIINYALLLGFHQITHERQQLNVYDQNQSQIPVTIKPDEGQIIGNQIRFYQSQTGGIWSRDNDYVYFIGIINIFTEYTGSLKVIHSLKSTFYGPGVSTIPPNQYSKRFARFIREHILQ